MQWFWMQSLCVTNVVVAGVNRTKAEEFSLIRQKRGPSYMVVKLSARTEIYRA